MSPAEATLAAFGDTVRLTAEVRDQNGQVMTGLVIAWSSSDGAVATVSESGLVTATGNGGTTITARAGSASGTAAVIVRQLPAAVAVAPESLTLRSPGDTATVTATVTDSNGHAIETPEVMWASADASVALVDENGLVVAVSEGVTEVTALAGGLTAGVAVTVESPPSISVEPASLHFAALGDTARLTARDTNGHPIDTARVRWSSRDSRVATVGPGGLVMATGDGSTTISATSGSASGTAAVTVRQLPAAVAVAPESLTLRSPGDTATVTATVTDSNGHTIETPEVVWASADASVALVDADGLVTAVSEGATEVTALAGGLTAGVAVTVESPSSISVEPASLHFAALGDTVRLTARDAAGHPIDTVRVRWSSRDSRVATVGPGGLVMATGDGSTTISATSGSASGTAAVTVEQLPAGITVAPRSLTLVVGDTTALEVTVVDANGHPVARPGVTWSSADSSVATVDAAGRVAGVGPGSTEVAATSDSLAASVDVDVITRSHDREALEALYRVTSGDDWTDNTHWLTDAPLSDWAGVGTDGSGRVRELSLEDNNLNGEIPASIGQLDRLVILNLRRNPLQGPIPPELGQLKELRDLLLSGTEVSGSLPPEMGDMTGLRYLHISNTNLSGPLPETFAQLALTTFDFAGSGLCLPPSLLAWFEEIENGSEDPLLCIQLTSDREALEALYRATGGDDWTDNTNWLTDAPLSDWAGVRTAGSGRVRHLSLEDNNLNGTIPASIGQLDRLFILDLRRNPLQGPIPPELGQLKELRDLVLTGTEVSGSLPPEMGDMTGLRFVSISNTNLSGPVPQTFARLAVTSFFFYDTWLCVPASLHAWFAQLEKASDRVPCVPRTADRDVLVALYEAMGGGDWDDQENWLSDISHYFWDGVKVNDDGYVTAIVLPRNNLTGSLPPVLGDLAHLEELRLHGNELTGAIPPEVGKLTKLRKLFLAENSLEGPIPRELGDLVNVNVLHLSINQLSGPIPPELGNMAALERMALFENRLSGPLPKEIAKLTKLKDLWLPDNAIEGPLPPELGDMVSLETIFLSRNQVSGPIPAEWGRLGSLRSLSLQDNRLEGTIPATLGNLSELRELTLSVNRLTGSIPRELGNLSNLESLSMFDNELSGAIPPELVNLQELETLWLADNRLTGAIPPELGGLTSLRDLHFGRNDLTGPIPPELATLDYLTHLALFNNDLSGPLPPEFGDLNVLANLSISHNPDLRGLLPRSMLNMTSLSSLHAGGTGLCAQLDAEFQAWLGEFDAALGDCDAAQVERLALSEFFAGAGGDAWTRSRGWNTNAGLDSWYGITTRGGRVSRLALADNGLAGAVPPEIANLTTLETLDLGDNHLAGELPMAIASMTGLTSIRLSGNEGMEGPLPSRLTELTRLESLEYEDTGLCASPAMRFQDWIGRIDVVAGATCRNADEVRLSLPLVTLTQAIQRPAGDVPLIAGREALLRVFLTSDRPFAFYEPEVAATFTRAGAEVHRVTMRRGGDVLAEAADQSDLRSSYNAVIPAEYVQPGVELVVEADPGGVVPRAAGSQVRFPASGAMPLTVIDVPPMEVTIVPVLEAVSPDSSIFEWTDNIGDDSPEVGLLRYSFPFSEFTARSREAYITSLDLTSDEDQWRLVLEMEALRAVDNGTGYYYAAAASVNGYVRGRARLAAWASIGKAWDTELAHEVGHNLDLLHAPCGGALGTDPDFPHSDGGLGAWGYDFRDGSVVSPERRRDIMGYCYERGWLSDYYFEKVIEYRERVEGDRAQALVAAARPRSETLVLWGGVVDGQLRFEPAFRVTAAPRLAEETGPYRIDGVGSAGETEFSLQFTPGEDQFGDKYFFFTIPIEPGWADSLDRITLTGPEGVVAVDLDDDRAVSVVTDRGTGRLRAILRDWDGGLPAALAETGRLDVSTSRGLRSALRLDR